MISEGHRWFTSEEAVLREVVDKIKNHHADCLEGRV